MNDIEKKWKPKYGEAYFTIENAVDVVRYIYIGDDIDKSCILSGDYFPTRERAEQVAKKIRLLLQLEQLHDQLCPDYVPDWESDEAKFYVYLSYTQSNWRVGSCISWENPCTAVFDTIENAKKAAEILNKELEESE